MKIKNMNTNQRVNYIFDIIQSSYYGNGTNTHAKRMVKVLVKYLKLSNLCTKRKACFFCYRLHNALKYNDGNYMIRYYLENARHSIRVGEKLEKGALV